MKQSGTVSKSRRNNIRTIKLELRSLHFKIESQGSPDTFRPERRDQNTLFLYKNNDSMQACIFMQDSNFYHIFKVMHYDYLNENTLLLFFRYAPKLKLFSDVHPYEHATPDDPQQTPGSPETASPQASLEATLPTTEVQEGSSASDDTSVSADPNPKALPAPQAKASKPIPDEDTAQA